MKRLLALFLILFMGISVCLPVQAQYSFQKDTVVEGSTVEDNAEDSSSSGKASSLPSDTEEENNATNSSNDAAAYGIDNLKDAPDITAESATLIDAASGAVLYGKEEDSKQYPASITKVMTALLAVENCSMDEIVTYSNEAVNGIEPGSSSAGINVGAKITVEDSLYALMLVSANEAAAALAEHISGSVEAFADMMNQRAKELGCTGTHFTNPHGLPDEEHYTTAEDMALIVRQAMQYEEFRTIAEADTYTLEQSDTLTNTLELWNHSKIIRESSDYYYEYAEGSKPGYTMAALNTLVTYAKKGNVELICVILRDYGADNSYYDTTALFEWGFEQVEGLTPLSSFDLNDAIGANSEVSEDKAVNIQRLGCTYPEDYYLLVKKGFDSSVLKTSFTMDEDIYAGRIGYINISAGDTVVGKVPVTYDTTTEAAKSYISNGSADDNLETAPVDEEGLTPGRIFHYILRIIVVLILLAILVSFIRGRQAEKRRQQRILERKKRHASSDTRGSGGRSANVGSRQRSVGTSAGSRHGRSSSSGTTKRRSSSRTSSRDNHMKKKR